MKPKKLFFKLFFPYFIISLAGLSLLLIITRFAFQNFYYNEKAKSLVQKAKLVESLIISELDAQTFKQLQVKVKDFAEKSGSRITIMLPDGKVVADSDYLPANMENHLNRSEVKEALNGGLGQSIRYSSTLRSNHLYVAIPLVYEKETIGVLRNAVSVAELNISFYKLSRNVILWSLLLLGILTYFIYTQARKISQPLEDIKEQVENFASNDFSKTLELKDTQTEEIEALSFTLKKMGAKLVESLNKIRKQKEEQLAVFSSLREGVITIYPDLNIFHINQAALNLFNVGISNGLKGKALSSIINSEEILAMAKNLMDTHSTVEEEIEYEEGKVLHVYGTIVHSKEQGVFGGVLVFDNITKMRTLENHRKDFVANVSHELKTPLTAIQGYVETIQEGDVDDPETLKKFMGIINKHTNRLKLIIEDLFTLSFLEKDSDLGEFDLVEQDLLPVLKNTIAMCAEKANKKNVAIVISGENYRVCLNQSLFEQAIINLVDNAIKYGPSDNEVKIELIAKNKEVEILIKDNGPGIGSEHHERLFERFYSVDMARSRELGGSGLGLSIVKHIILSHNGNIRVESDLGQGATFIVTMPICS